MTIFLIDSHIFPTKNDSVFEIIIFVFNETLTKDIVNVELVVIRKCWSRSIKSVSGHMSHVMRKPTFSTCENKDADQLRGKREADQRLCFRYMDSTIPLLPKFKISRL